MARRHWVEDALDGILANLEYGAMLGTTAAIAPVAELANLGAMAFGQSAEEADALRQKLYGVAYQPQTETARRQLGWLGGKLEPAMEWADENIADPLRDKLGAETVAGLGSVAAIVPVPARAGVVQNLKTANKVRKAEQAAEVAAAPTKAKARQVERKNAREPVVPVGRDRTTMDSLLIPEGELPEGRPTMKYDASGEPIIDELWAQPGGGGMKKGEPVAKKLTLLTDKQARTQHGTPVPVVNEKGVPVSQTRRTSPMLLEASDKVLSPYYNRPTVRDPQRIMFPDIYADERIAIATAADLTGPENPLMRQLFRTDRQDLDTIMAERAARGPVSPGGIPWPQGRGAPDYIQNIMTPANERRLQNLLHLGANEPSLTGSYGWYELSPLRDRFIQELGVEEGLRRFDQMQQWSSAMSARSSPLPELQRYSLANYLQHQGFPEKFLNATAADFDKSGFGALGHGTHVGGMKRGMETGFFADTGGANAAKTRQYYASHFGDPWWPVIDAHMARQIGLADVRTSAPENNWGMNIQGSEARPVMEWWQNRVAGPVGLPAGPAQALIWNALGPATGLRTPGVIGRPKLEMFTDLIQQRAAATRRSPDDVLKAFIHGEDFLGSSPLPRSMRPSTPYTMGYSTHEMIPGAGTDHLKHMLDAPEGSKTAFTRKAGWVDESGRDVINRAVHAGRPDVGVPPSREGTGLFTPAGLPPESQPLVTAPFNVPSPGGQLDPDALARQQSGDAARALLDAQNMGAGHIPVPSDAPNALRVDLGRGLTLDQMTKLTNELKKRNLPLSPSDTGNGVTLFDETHWYGDANPPAVTAGYKQQLDDALTAAGIQHKGSYGVESNSYAFDYQSELASANQGKGMATQKMLDTLDALGSRGNLGTDPAVKAKVLEKLKVMETGNYGVPREDVKNLLRIVGNAKGDWVPELKKALAAGAVLPATLLLVFGEEQIGSMNDTTGGRGTPAGV